MATSEQYNTQKYENEHHDFAEACDEIRKKHRVSKKLTKKDLVDFPRGKVGDIITMNPPIPDNTHDAFELFKNYYAAIQFELQKFLFIEKYKIWNKASVSTEIKEIEAWIKEAKEGNYSDALNGVDKHLPKFEYLRLSNGYYDGYLMTWQEHQENSTAASVYGRYFLFYDYLREKLSSCQNPNTPTTIKLDIDFEDLPRYVIEQGILQPFEKLHHVLDIRSQDYFTQWEKSYRAYFTTIPKEYIVKTIRKGIEYGKKTLQHHLQYECTGKNNCMHDESWERRIALAENLMNAILKDNKPTRMDFSNWILGKPDWNEIAWRYNTGREFQHKQDLAAVFWNGYIYFQEKFEAYYQEFQVIPTDYFQKLIFEFRQKFPKSGRVEAINYFDDLIEQLIERYEKIATDNVELETINEQPESNAKNKDFTTARQVLAIHYLLEYCEVRGIDSTAKARFIQFLTGKETGAANIKNTTIYRRVRSPLGKDDKKLIEDLQYIRTYFEELGIKEIAESITKEINTKTD